MKAIFQFAQGWPVILLALASGFGGAVASGKTEDQTWFLIGFAIDLVLIAGYVLTNDEVQEAAVGMQAAYAAPCEPAPAPVVPESVSEGGWPAPDDRGATPTDISRGEPESPDPAGAPAIDENTASGPASVSPPAEAAPAATAPAEVAPAAPTAAPPPAEKPAAAKGGGKSGVKSGVKPGPAKKK